MLHHFTLYQLAPVSLRVQSFTKEIVSVFAPLIIFAAHEFVYVSSLLFSFFLSFFLFSSLLLSFLFVFLLPPLPFLSSPPSRDKFKRALATREKLVP